MQFDVIRPHTDNRSAALTHLCWQAAYGRTFFPHEALYDRVRERLIDAHRREGRVLLAFTLLPTEIHAITQTAPDDRPGDVARAIGNVVTRWVRGAQRLRGPVLAGRYRAHALDTLDALRDDVRMLAWRPVACQACAAPVHFPYGSLRVACGLAPARGFDARPLLSVFGKSVEDARQALRLWLASKPSDEQWRRWELERGLVLAMNGSAPGLAAAAEVKTPEAAALLATDRDGSVDAALRLLEAWVVASLHHNHPVDLYRDSDPTSARARALVGLLAMQHKLCSAASVARHFGRAKATLSQQMAVCRARRADRRIVATPVRRIIAEALPLRK